jgi:twitching motility protein PilU
MLKEGIITQEEALANSDSPTNLLWLINNTEAGGNLQGKDKSEGQSDTPAPPPSSAPMSFSEIKLDLSEA